MGYSNSKLVVHTNLSPNHSGQRTHVIDRISPHCVVGQVTIENLGGWFALSSTQASSNYGIDKDGRIGMFVPESCRSWCTSSNANDQRAITIECASDTKDPYTMNACVYQSLVELCTDICRRNGKNKLLWIPDKNTALNYNPKADEMLITVHRWFDTRSCPGDWLYSRLGDLAQRVTKALDGDSAPEPVQTGLQAKSLKSMTDDEVIKTVGALFTEDEKKSGILACVSLAQFILESGFGKSELAQNANNAFGMKRNLSGNTWGGSTWDGVSVYSKTTQEQNADGSMVNIVADFRKYPNLMASINDHSAYLLGAMNGNKKRYEGLAGCTDYAKAVKIIKDGGYATSLTYCEKLCNIIQKYGLAKYNVPRDILPETPAPWYRVRKTWKDAGSQIGAYHDVELAKQCAKKNEGYKVFNESGKEIYPAFTSYTVAIKKGVNILKAAGSKTVVDTFKFSGVYTIVDEKNGYGKLKSGAGWVSLKDCSFCPVMKSC